MSRESLAAGNVESAKACEDLQCTVDYINTLTCRINNRKEETLDISHPLSATWTCEDSEEESCQLDYTDNQKEHTCNLHMDLLGADDTYWIFINRTVYGQNISTACGPYRFCNTFQPTPPFNLTVSFSEQYYNFSWRTDYENPQYYLQHDEMGYELSYKKKKQSWKNHKSIQILEDEKSVSLLKTQFQENEDYVARVRAKPKNSSVYKGPWSGWSPLVTWSTQPNVYYVGIWGSLHWIIPLCLGIIITLFVISKPFKLPQRLWKKMCGFVPNPAPFFKPLYIEHNWDFKSWLGTSYYTTGLHFESRMSIPEVLEIYNHKIDRHASKSTQHDMESHEKLLFKTCCTNHGKGCQKGRCSTDLKGQSFEHISISTVLVTDEDISCCSQCIPSSGTYVNAHNDDEENNSDDGYPPVTTDSSSNNLGYLVDNQSHIDDPVRDSAKHGHSVQESLLRSKENILDLTPIPPEQWKLQECLSQDDENLFYCDEAFSPGSGNSEEFCYQRMCLDMDTIDSGFVDSECGSPVESEFGNGDVSPTMVSSESYPGEEACLRNYVKQWVPSNPTTVGALDRN
ncbi:interleukin-21 receptor [Pelodytes ibericus]